MDIQELTLTGQEQGCFVRVFLCCQFIKDIQKEFIGCWNKKKPVFLTSLNYIEYTNSTLNQEENMLKYKYELQ